VVRGRGFRLVLAAAVLAFNALVSWNVVRRRMAQRG
jgi:hypothetical protein